MNNLLQFGKFHRTISGHMIAVNQPIDGLLGGVLLRTLLV
jgi:hypothetical protein